MTYTFRSPIFPPSVNSIWRAFAQGRRVSSILTENGRNFRRAMLELVQAARFEGTLPKEPFTRPVAVRLDLYQPDRRRRDVDNYAKAVFDALTHAGVWHDDSQVDVAIAVKHPARSGMTGFRLMIRER